MADNNFGLTTFDSSGKLTQIDNSFKAVSNGDTSLGIVAKDGVVIATEKKTLFSIGRCRRMGQSL